MHVGCMGLAPASHDVVDSIPPMPSGGNLDDKRIGVGMTMYYPVEVAGGAALCGNQISGAPRHRRDVVPVADGT